MENYTLRLSGHLTGNTNYKRLVIECSDYLTFESVAIYKESDPKVKHAEQIVETLNKHHGNENYFLIRDLDADHGNNTIGIIGSGNLETDAQKDEFISKLLKVFSQHYDAEDCGIDSINGFFENYLMYGKEYQSKLWYREGRPDKNKVSFTIERILLY